MESRESVDLDFGRYLSSFKRHWVPAVSLFAVSVTLTVLATPLLMRTYEAEGKLLFKIDRISSLTGVAGETGELRSLVFDQNPLSTELEVLTSNPLLQKTIDTLDLKNKKGEPLKLKEIKKLLTVKIVGGTDVVEISYKSKNPQEAATVVNTLMNFYIEDNILNSRTEAVAAREFLAKQLPYTENAVLETEAAFRNFKESNKVVDLQEESKLAVRQIADLDSQITVVQAELDRVNAQTAALQNKVGLNSQQSMSVSAVSQSVAVRGVLEKLQEVEQRLATERTRFADGHPAIISLEADRASLKALLQKQSRQVVGSGGQVPTTTFQIGELRQELIKDFLKSDVERQSLTRRLSSLYNARTGYKQRVNILPQLEQRQRDLERKVEAATSTHQTLLRKYRELEVAANKNTGNARIVARALVPEKPQVGKQAIALVGLGLLFGAFLSTSTVLFLELRDRSLKTLKEIKEVFGYPLLGIIPFFGKKVRSRNGDAELMMQIPVVDAPRSLVSEIFRMIQANLKFLSSDKTLKTIVIASSVPKEGKSTVAANLAAAMAQLGRQVLLIDADMRLPSQHHIWKLTNLAGLSEVLVGQAQFNTAVCQVMEHLDVLTAGVMPPNPLALLDSKRMASLLKELSEQYDFIIIDAPPLMIAADALTLSQMTDGILLVARPGVIDSTTAAAGKEMLERSGQNVLGLVVNGALEKNDSSGSFYKEYFPRQEAEARRQEVGGRR